MIHSLIIKQFSPTTEILIGLLMITGLWFYGDFLFEIPILGFFLAMFGWIIPIAFIWGGIENLKKLPVKKELSDYWPPR